LLKENGAALTEYQYHLKDHLGNVRLTFTTGGGTMSSMVATMETENAELEESAFENIEATRQVDALYNVTEGGNTSARLNAAEGRVMGPWTSLHLMPGDTVRMSVYAKYDEPAKTNEGITGMAGIIAATLTQETVTDLAMQVTEGLNQALAAGGAGLLAKDNGIPKAYLNYIFFDAEMKTKSANFKQVSEAAHGSFEKLELEFIAEEEGYLMAYTSNETNEDLNVFIDQMSLTHTTGPIVRMDDYYPFGMVYKTSELDGKLTNKFLYNGKEKQELTDWYDYGARMYDPALGRWHTIDPMAEKYPIINPYNYCFNNPVNLFDPDGMDPDSDEQKLINYYQNLGYNVNSIEGVKDAVATIEKVNNVLSEYGEESSISQVTSSEYQKKLQLTVAAVN